MNKFVLDIKNGQFTINSRLAKIIYQKLNKTEKEEIDKWKAKNPDKTLGEIITILYGTLSQRRRMNPRLVSAIESYIKKYPKCNFKVITLKKDTDYIEECFNIDGSEYLTEYNSKNYKSSDSESVEKWKKQITISDDVQAIDNKNEKEFFKVNIKEQKVTFYIKLKRFFKKIKRSVSFGNSEKEREYLKNLTIELSKRKPNKII